MAYSYYCMLARCGDLEYLFYRKLEMETSSPTEFLIYVLTSSGYSIQ